MLQQPAGDQHEGVVRIRTLIGRHQLRGHEPRPAVRGGKAVDEDHRLPRMVLVRAGIGDRARAFEPRPGDALDRRHQLAHLLPDLGGAAVLPVEPQPARHLDDEVQILACLARRLQRLPRQLHAAVGVGEAAGLLRKGGRRQDHVGQHRSLGRENLLHHQPVEPGQRGPRMLQVRVGHGRVLTHDVHAADAAGLGGIHDLDHGEPGRGVQPDAPMRFEAGQHGRIVDPLVVRQHHRDQTGVRRPLHVVLAAQRMQAGARTANLPGQHRQRDQAAHVVGAVHVL